MDLRTARACRFESPGVRSGSEAFLSRRTDRAALKYERLAKDVPRQFICIATAG